MLVSQLHSTQYPALTFTDKVSFALHLMDEYDVNHLPVLNAEKYTGIISKDDLLDADESAALYSLQDNLIKVSVKENEFFMRALKQAADNELSMVAITNTDNELTATVHYIDLIKAASVFNGAEDKGAIIIIEMDKRNFSFGEITRLVETNNAYITQLNTTVQPDTGMLLLTLKINKFEVSDIVATFQRYDYDVKYYFGDEHFANEIKENYALLMNYLNM